MKNFKGLLPAIISSATFGFIPLFSIPLLKSGISLDLIYKIREKEGKLPQLKVVTRFFHVLIIL